MTSDVKAAVQLNLANLSILPASIDRPDYERRALTPGILHVGVGNFHRAHFAVYMDELLAQNKNLDWAIVGAGIRPADKTMRQKLQAQDWLASIIERDASAARMRVTGAMIDFLPIDGQAITETLQHPDIKIVSLTLTEGGYYLDPASGVFDANHPDIQADIANPFAPKTLFGMIIKALRFRRKTDMKPFTVLSCDNLIGNGHIAKSVVLGLAAQLDSDLATWIEDHVAFPNSMVDRITPATSDRERSFVLDTFGVEDRAPVICEPFRQWVVEDNFSNGRPLLEEVGVEFVEDVTPYELMKLRILNAGHAAIAYVSLLLGYRYVHDAMADDDIRHWLHELHTRETLKTLDPIPGTSYSDYLATVIERFSNPSVGDTVARLAAEGADRQPKFILPTLRDALATGGAIEGLCLEIALWAYYCDVASGSDEDFQLKDTQVQILSDFAERSRIEPGAFLDNRIVFGDLGENSDVRTIFSNWLICIREQGVRKALCGYISAV